MGFFDFLKSDKETSQKERKVVPWKRLTHIDQLDRIIKDSWNKPVAIFKHSTRCGISRMVLRQFEGSYDLEQGEMDLYFLDLLAFRDVSDEVAASFQVMHESPQLIVVRNGITAAHASHHGIRASELTNFV